jgi:2,5-diamino-6-(ribosylamino)-4(3H)-pyrimidinone 5'-phosphate reductase
MSTTFMPPNFGFSSAVAGRSRIQSRVVQVSVNAQPNQTMPGPPDILASVLGVLPADVKPGTAPLPDLVSPDSTRPYVTLTFAQSIDAKIAGAGGRQLILSGEESMEMTHW